MVFNENVWKRPIFMVVGLGLSRVLYREFYGSCTQAKIRLWRATSVVDSDPAVASYCLKVLWYMYKVVLGALNPVLPYTTHIPVHKCENSTGIVFSCSQQRTVGTMRKYIIRDGSAKIRPISRIDSAWSRIQGRFKQAKNRLTTYKFDRSGPRIWRMIGSVGAYF